ncbi:MAG: AAA family ATPase [Acutalibacteraceae bacterium]
MGRVLSVTSGKGGVGKSTVTCGLGTALSRLGFRVLAVDCDSGLRCLDLMLSTSKDSAFNLADVISGEADISQSAVAVSEAPGLYVLSAPQYPEALNDLNGFKTAVRSGAESFDYVLLDCPAGIGKDFESVVSVSDGIMIAATPDPVSVRDAETAAERAGKLTNAPSRLIINRFDIKLVKKGLYLNIDKMIDGTAVRLIGVVPEDKAVHRSLIMGNPPAKGCAAKAFMRIARRIRGERVSIPKAKKI